MTLSDNNIVTYAYNEWNIRTIITVRNSFFSKSKLTIYSLRKYSVEADFINYIICRNRFEITLRILLLQRTHLVNFVQFLASEPILKVIFALKKFNKLIHIDDGSMFLNSHIGGLVNVTSESLKLKKLLLGFFMPSRRSYLDLSNMDYAFLFNLDLFEKEYHFNCQNIFSLNHVLTKQIKSNKIQDNLTNKDIPIIFGSALVEHGYVSLNTYVRWINRITKQYEKYFYVPHPSERNINSKYSSKGSLLQLGIASEYIICSAIAPSFHCFASTATFLLSQEFPLKNFVVHLIPSLQKDSLIKAIDSRSNITIDILTE